MVSQLASGAVSSAAKALRIKGISAAILKTPAVISMAQVVGRAPSLERTCLRTDFPVHRGKTENFIDLAPNRPDRGLLTH